MPRSVIAKRAGAIAVVLLTAAAFAYTYVRSPLPEPRPGASQEERVAYWQKRIERDGAEAAYDALDRATANLSPTKRHAAAHEFGGALFDLEGKRGIRVCDERFTYGCFHQLLGESIAAEGLGVVESLNQMCIDSLAGRSSLACQHGLGHGIQTYLGYEQADLERGLEVCRDLNNNRIGGCYGGIFMEFNLRTMWGEAAIPRETDLAHAGDDCEELLEFRASCLFWSPQWWLQALFGDTATPDNFRVIGGICAKTVRTEAERRDCFEGVGTMAPQKAEYDVTGVVERCSAVSNRTRDVLYCRSMAANILRADVGAAAANDSCSGLSGNALEYCMSYARNEVNIFYRPEVAEEPL